MKLKKASRAQVKLRVGLSSPSGAGKTFSSLQLAHGMCKDWTKIVLIDTENGSGELYSSLGEYNVLTLKAPFSPERYIEAIESCEKAGMEVIIIDSISHEWEGSGGCLQINDNLANTKFKGNTWAAWSATTPRHQAFIQKIIQADAHIITTVRNKVESAQVNGKVKKVGTKELTREGFEYELTVNFNIERDSHFATASKDRTGLFIDADPFLIGEKTGKQLIKWNNSGAAPIIEEEEEDIQEVEVKKTPAKKAKVEVDKFAQFYEEMKMAANEDQLNVVLDTLREQVKTGEVLLDSSEMNQIKSLKEDMIASFASKEQGETKK